jgi:hypothetical protein
VEHVSGQALGMNAHQDRLRSRDVAHAQDNRFLYLVAGGAFKSENSKMPETARKIGFCDLA